MTNPFDEVRQQVRQAREQLQAVDGVAFNMADLLVGRLRHVDSHRVLAMLKKELRDFDAVTGKWKEPGHG